MRRPFREISGKRLLFFLFGVVFTSVALGGFILNGCGDEGARLDQDSGRPATERLAEARSQGMPVFLEFYEDG